MRRYRRRVWVLAWTPEEAADMKGEPGVIVFRPIGLDPHEEFKVPCKCHDSGWHYGTSMAAFESRAEAKAYRDKFYSYPNGGKSWGIYYADLVVHGK